MQSRIVFSVLSLTLVFLLSSCIAYQDVKFLGMQGYNVQRLDQKGMEVEISIKVHNPNNYKISIVNADLDLFVNKKYLGKAKVRKNIVLPANSTGTHQVNLSAKFNKQSAAALVGMASLFSSRSVNLGLKGTLTGKVKMIRKKVDLDITRPIRW